MDSSIVANAPHSCKTFIIKEISEWGEGDIGEHSILSAQCFSKPNTAVKITSY